MSKFQDLAPLPKKTDYGPIFATSFNVGLWLIKKRLWTNKGLSGGAIITINYMVTYYARYETFNQFNGEKHLKENILLMNT